MVKNPPANAKDSSSPLDWEDPLDKEMANPYSCLEYPMDRGARRLPYMGRKEPNTAEQLNRHTSMHMYMYR